MFERGLDVSLSQQERLELVAAQLSRVHARMGLDDPGSRGGAFPVVAGLSGVFGSVVRGSVVSVQGSTSLALRLVAEASRQGEWLAVVGAPRVGMVAAARCGVDLSRVVMIPDPAGQVVDVLGACVAGMRMVVVGPVSLSAAQRRRLMVMARESRTLMVVLGAWDGAAVEVRGRAQVSGLGAGRGRVVGQRIDVMVRHRGGPWREEHLEWTSGAFQQGSSLRSQPLAAG